MRVRTLLVDDHPVVIEGMSAMLEDTEDIHVACVCNSGADALQWLERLPIDAVVTDVTMPDMSGIDLTRAVLRRWPEKKVIALSMHAEAAYVREMFRAGATAYVLKDCARSEIVNAIRSAFLGRAYVSERIAGLADLRTNEQTSPIELLTARERQILLLIAQGESSKDIAERLGISPNTVETHRAHIFSKLDLRNVVELTRFAIQHGLTTL